MTWIAQVRVTRENFGPFRVIQPRRRSAQRHRMHSVQSGCRQYHPVSLAANGCQSVLLAGQRPLQIKNLTCTALETIFA